MRIFVFIFALVVVALLPVALHADSPDHIHLTTPPRLIPPLIFEDGIGGQHALADYRGHFVLLNIWATWCAPCVREMPSLDALQKDFDPRQLIILPLSEDRGDAAVNAFYFTHKIMRLPVAVDAAGVAPSVLGLRGLPTTLLINPRGLEIARLEGDAVWNSPQAVAFLRTQLIDK